MFKVLFGDITNGRLMRLSYLGYSVLLALSVIGFGLAIVLAIGAGEHLIGGNFQQAQDKLREWFTLPFFIIFGLVSTLFTFGGMNIMAKRIRDIGLPGWWAVLVITVLEGSISFIVSGQAGSSLHTLIGITLLLLPTNALAKMSQ
ncbi:MAG: DUF805 domain-containing protein [Thermodesulfobacteriota bacterium]|nr:DUF805 domain-containing protein [Thermodesulfobacteriota bacterium]